MRMRIVALFRVSTEKQFNQGASLAAQERRFDELAVVHGWRVLAKLRGSESATKAASDREVLQSALRVIREQEADAIYVHEQSRLTRGDELEVALLMRELRERQVKIIVCGQQRDLESIDERFMFRIQSVVDRAEIERLKERVTRGKREKAKQGRWFCGNAPFGYVNPPVGDPQRGTLRIVPEEAETVRRVFRMYERGMSINQVVATLRAERVPASRGGLWCASAVKRLLDNPAYIGTLAAYRWRRCGRLMKEQEPELVTEQAHEPIIERAVWNIVRDRRANERGRGGTPALLTGLLHINGKPAFGQSGHGRIDYGWRNGPQLDRKSVDAAVWGGISRMLQTPAFIDRIRQEIAGAGDRDQRQNQSKSNHRQIGRLEKRLEGFTTMRADGDITRSDYERRVNETRQQIAALKRQASEVARDRGGEFEQAVEAARVIVRGGLPQEFERRIIESLASRVDIEAHSSGTLTRDQRGRVTGTTGRRWKMRNLSLEPHCGGAITTY